MSKTKETPKELEPVLAEINSITCLGRTNWYEVVYHDGDKWCGYSGSDTFDDGESVLRWRYAAEAMGEIK